VNIDMPECIPDFPLKLLLHASADTDDLQWTQSRNLPFRTDPMQRMPARPGDPVASIETPALVLDLDPFERNLELMASVVRGSRLALRPHAKSHKCPDIAKRQVASGAVGICCQKVDEAAAFVEAGIRDVLVTNEIVVPSKLARLAQLARTATIGVLADGVATVGAISAAAVNAGVTLDVLVEIDVGAHRCGVAPGPDAVVLAQVIAAAPSLHFRGLHAYHGAAQHLRMPQERRAAIAAAVQLARTTRDLVVAAGLACPTITGAGTGTWQLERDSQVYTELQPGSYIFMDADYGRNALAPDDHEFEQSLYVTATVMSVPAPERAVIDAGLKAFAFDSGPPLVHAAHGLEYGGASDEHGVLRVDPAVARPMVGDRVWLVPGHCDPTVNLYDWIVGVRGDRVECVWPVAARGALG
jgi:D-serine deaminase-like pyridoxal phosphate-dependent protein